MRDFPVELADQLPVHSSSRVEVFVELSGAGLELADALLLASLLASAWATATLYVRAPGGRAHVLLMPFLHFPGVRERGISRVFGGTARAGQRDVRV